MAVLRHLLTCLLLLFVITLFTDALRWRQNRRQFNRLNRQHRRNRLKIRTNDNKEYVTLHMAEVAEVVEPVHDRDLRSSVDTVRASMKRMQSSLCDVNAIYRTVDGSCNNLRHPMWGTPMRKQLRLIPSQYDDGLSKPRYYRGQSTPLPSARSVSQACHPHDDAGKTSTTLSNMAMQWGQFLDHDITGTPESNNTKDCCLDLQPNGTHPDYYTGDECFPIAIEAGDRIFTTDCMEFRRSMPAEKNEKREQINIITAFIDASNVYGVTPQEHIQNRAFVNGALREGDHGLLQTNTTIQRPCLKSDIDGCFFSGDVRANEFPALTSMHTVFHREHNRIAGELSVINPHWDDETLFQETRKIIAAYMQIISYDEFLPVIMGETGMKRFGLISPYRYKPQVNPEITNSFSTAAYRFGHSMIDSTFKTLRDPKQNISDMFFRPSFNMNGNGAGMDVLIEGMIEAPCQKSDKFFAKGVSDHLFQDFPTTGIAFDLAARNIQRGRDHGLPPYTEFRRYSQKYYKTLNNFPSTSERGDYITNLGKRFGRRRFAMSSGTRIPRRRFRGKRAYRLPRAQLGYQCMNVYNNNYRDVDLFVGAMSEEPVDGGVLGPTFATIIGLQFHKLKHSDRFWYEAPDTKIGFKPEQLRELKKTTLARIFCDNTRIPHVQKDVFRLANAQNPVLDCNGLGIPRLDLTQWKEKAVLVRDEYIDTSRGQGYRA